MSTDDDAVFARVMQRLTPSDFRLVDQARARGGNIAAEKMILLIGRRINEHERQRIAMMGADVDASWPPSFLRR